MRFAVQPALSGCAVPWKNAFSSFNFDIPGFLLFDSGREYSLNGNLFEPMVLDFLI